MIFLEDPCQGDTIEQEQAYWDLERLGYDNIKDVFTYMNDFYHLSAKSGKMFYPDVSDKFFKKMSPLYGKELEKAFQERFSGTIVRILP